MLELKSIDDALDSSKVPANYVWMKENGVQVALGCVTSGPCLEFAHLSNADNMFFLTPTASADAIVTGSQNGYQMCFSEGNQGAVAAAYVNELAAAGELGKLGIFYNFTDAYSTGIYAQFVAALDKAKTGEPVVAAFASDNEDFTSHIEDLAACDFIFMPIYYTPAAKFMVYANGRISDDAVYYGCDGFDGIESAYGFDISEIPQRVIMLSHFDDKATTGHAAAYIDAYKTRYGETARVSQFGASAYDCVYAILGAMNKAIAEGQSITASTTASEMCAILKAQFDGDYVYSGAVTGTGTVSWSADGFVQKAGLAYVIKEASH